MLHLVFGVVADLLAGDVDLAGVGLEEAHDVLEGYGFADAAAAEDAEGLPGIDVEAYFIEHDQVSEGLGDFIEGNVRRDPFVMGRLLDDFDFGDGNFRGIGRAGQRVCSLKI